MNIIYMGDLECMWCHERDSEDFCENEGEICDGCVYNITKYIMLYFAYNLCVIRDKRVESII